MTTQRASAQSNALPPQLMLYQLGVGHYVSRALYVGTKLGIADLLADGPRTFDELATATRTHGPSLRRVLRLLASVGVFAEREDGRFELTPLAELLRKDVAGSMRSAVLLFTGIGIQDSWREIEYCVQTGQPAFRRTSPDGDAFSHMARDPEQGVVFDEAMAAFTAQTAIAVAAAYDFSTFGTVMDVGGGNGALLIGILNANPNLRGIVFDMPRVIDGAANKIAAAGLGARCDAVGGDFFELVPNGADAYLLKHVIHDWDDAKAAAILRNCHRAMTPGCKLLIVEGVYPPRIDQSLASRGAAANDVNMLVCTGGRQRSESEFRSLYETAGFRLTRIIPTMAGVCVIEGERV
jgi:SAM-dependent methyltransferase